MPGLYPSPIGRIRRIGCALVLITAAGTCAAPAAVARRSELVRSTFASRAGELHFFWNHADPSPTAPVAAGPVLTLDRVVWAEQRAPGIWRVHEAPLRGASAPSRSTPYQPHTSPVVSELLLGASRRRVAVADHTYSCPVSRCGGLSHLASWRFGGRPRVIASCPRGSGCSSPCSYIAAPAVAGDWIAHLGGCSNPPVVVRDLAPGGVSYRIRANAHGVRMAGRFIAYDKGSPNGGVVVYDRLARHEVFRVADAAAVELQRDGTVLFRDTRNRVAWASPSDPRPHLIPPPPRDFGPIVGLAHDRIAFTRNADHPYLGIQVVVVDLRGHVVVHRTIRPFVGQVAFDGRRLAFATQSCQTTAVAVWDIRDPAPPAESHRPCPTATAASRIARVTPSRRMRVRLRCPHYHRLGCAGRLHLAAFASGHYSAIGTRTYNLPFDRTAGVSMRIRRDARRFLAAHRDARIFGSTRAARRTIVNSLFDEGPTRTDDFLLRLAN
jgi:hypothetical protein